MRYELNFEISSPETGARTKIHTPCSFADIKSAMERMGVSDIYDARVRIENSDCPVMALLNGTEQNLFELKCLGDHIHSLDVGELDTFEAVLSTGICGTVADMINLTVNTDCFTLAADFRDTASISRQHYLRMRGCAPPHELEELDADREWQEMNRSGNPTVTPFGVLYDAKEEWDELYDGFNLPFFPEESDTVFVELTYGGRRMFINLPVDDYFLDSAAGLLGAECIEDCEATRIEMLGRPEPDIKEICPGLSASDLHALNRFAEVWNNRGYYGAETEKLEAVMKYADRDDIAAAVYLADNLESFEYYFDADSEEELGRILITETEKYSFDWELEDYYDYKRFGADYAKAQHGEFPECGGYIGCSDWIVMENIPEPDEAPENAIQTGGMQ